MLLLTLAAAGCGAEPDSTDTDFFAQQTALECALLSTCDAASFAERFDDEADCLERLNQGDACEVVDDEQAALCLTIMDALTCDDLDGNDYLPSLPNCAAAITCSGLE